MSDDIRFDRIEKSLDRFSDKLGELTKVVTDLARVEERIVTLFKRMDRYDEAHSKMDAKLSTLEKTSTRRGVLEAVLDKGFWLVGGALLAWYLRK